MKIDCRRRAGPACALWALIALLNVAPTLAANAKRPQPALENPVFQAIPLERSSQNHLLVRAEINGKPALLGVDSGAPVSAISAARRKYFEMSALPGGSKLPARLRINGGFNRVTIAHRLRLGALTLIDEPMVAIDLRAPARARKQSSEQELDGILGADILFPTKAVLDCEAQVLFMKIDPDAPGNVPGVDRRGWKNVPIRVTKGWNLYVDGKLNGKPAQLMIDTGAFTTLIHRPFVREMRLPLRDTPYTSGAVNLEERGLQLATIRRFAIGPFLVKGKEVGVMDLQGLIHGDLLKGEPPVAGLLGSEFLRRNHAIIDFGTRTLYLKL
ncbi:MAG: aspartyl protease family protein [Chthoniobacterales bacterium]|nr:aspartyl protease family protein [Chthoniobacterales bacterium]